MPDKLLFQDNNRKRNCDETGFNNLHFAGEYPQTRT